MKIGLFLASGSANEILNSAITADEFGYDSVWVTDHLMDTGGRNVDPWTTIACMCLKTKNVFMSPGVTDVQRIHPAKTAQIVATLDEVSSGRIGLGIGAGEAMSLTPFGLPFDEPNLRVLRLSEAIRVIQLLWSSSREKDVSFCGDFFNLDRAWLNMNIQRKPPIYVGSLGGTKALEMTGELADGWMSWVNNSDSFRLRIEIIKKAAQRANRDIRKLDCVGFMYASMADKPAEIRAAIDEVKRILLMEVHTLRLLKFDLPETLEPYQSLLVRASLDKDLKQIQDIVPDELALEFIALGPPEEMISKIKKFQEVGATHFVLRFLEGGNDPIRKFAEKVLPQIRNV